MHALACVVVLSVSGAGGANSRSARAAAENFPGDRVFGKVTAVSGDSVTISPQGGSDATVDSKTPFTIKV